MMPSEAALTHDAETLILLCSSTELKRFGWFEIFLDEIERLLHECYIELSLHYHQELGSENGSDCFQWKWKRTPDDRFRFRIKAY